MATVPFDEFKKLDLRVGKIVAAERIEGSDRLLRLEVDIGTDPSTSSGRDTRQIVAGIARHYAPEAIVGREIIVVANLEPKLLRGVESQGMLLAASCDAEPVLLFPEREVPPGSIVT